MLKQVLIFYNLNFGINFEEENTKEFMQFIELLEF